MKAIVNVNNDWAIGKDNTLLFQFPEDLTHFKDLTYGNTIIYGRKTLETFPNKNPLVGRQNIVITKDSNNIPYTAKYNCDYCIEIDDTNPEYYFMGFGINNSELSNNNSTSLFIVHNLEQALHLVKSMGNWNRSFVCGGESIYNQFLPYCTECEVTYTRKDYGNAPNKFFHNLDMDAKHWSIINRSYDLISPSTGIRYEFLTYKRILSD